MYGSYGGFNGDVDFYPGGVYHGFMPICVEAVPMEDYLIWLESMF